MSLEFWFLYESDGKKEDLRLPVPPEEFKIQKGQNINTININDLGEIAVIGEGKLDKITISSFFPTQVYAFCQYSDFPKPYDCTKLIDKWRLSRKPIRLVITDTNINMLAAIESFEYGENDGSGDVYFDIQLTQYRPLKAESKESNGTNLERATDRTVPRTYRVLKGDTLWGISKKFYGTGTRSGDLAQKNNISEPNNLQTGQELMLV